MTTQLVLASWLGLLSRLNLFSMCSSEELAELASHFKRRTYRKGDFVYLTGDPPSGPFLIVRGLVKCEFVSPEGERFTVSILQRGAMFSEMSAGLNLPHDRSVSVMERSEILSMEPEEFRRFLLDRPEAMEKFMLMMSRRHSLVNEVLQDILFLDVSSRLAKFLLDPRRRGVYHTDGESTGLTQIELALLVGASRESVNKCLHHFIQSGLILQQGHRITVLDPAGLSRYLPAESA